MWYYMHHDVYTRLHTQVNMCTYIHTYIYTYTYAHTCTSKCILQYPTMVTGNLDSYQVSEVVDNSGKFQLKSGLVDFNI